MALTCGFYNSVDGDRKYDATQFASLFDGVITDGVVAAVGDFFATTPGGGMTVDVGTGRAWFNRTWTYSDAKTPLTLDASDLLYDRIDAVVLEIDTSIAIRDNSIKVVKGTPAQSPQKPTLTNAGDVHQYALAYVRVKASAIEIGAGDITINVGQTDCPFVTSIVETPELDVLFARWDAQFTEWFKNVQSQLEGDVATNLQRQIDLKADKATIGTLKNAAALLGISEASTVGNFMDVLANIGNLYVWKKTIETSSSGYTLSGERSNGDLVQGTEPGRTGVSLEYADSISVASNGVTITLNSSTSVNLTGARPYEKPTLTNKFVRMLEESATVPYVDFKAGDVIFVTGDLVMDGAHFYFTKYKKVKPHKRGTTVSFPVSTKSNAYSSSGNTTYEKLGTLGDKIRIETIEYLGTGVSGSITKNYKVKPLFIMLTGWVGNGTSNSNHLEGATLIAPYGIEKAQLSISSNFPYTTISFDYWGTGYVRWNTGSNADTGFNRAGETYKLTVVGY